MADYLLDKLQVEALWEIVLNNFPDFELLPPDGVLSFTHRLVVRLVKDFLTKYHRGQLTSEYLSDLPQNIRTLLQQAETKFQNGDLSSIKELAQKVLSVLEGPAHSSERLETAEGDTEDGQNLHPEMIPDPNTSQRDLSSDLITDPTVLAIPDSGIYEIPEIQEPAAGAIESLIPARMPHISDFEISKKIGAGAFGSVYLVRHKDLHHTFAMKKMTMEILAAIDEVDGAYLERDILTFCDCPFVASMLCSFPTTSHLCMVMEYVEGGDCQTLLDTRGPLSVPLARLYFAEAVVAVEYLHSYGVVHRDLKPGNLLITSTGHIKVTDFGASKLGVMIPKKNNYKQVAEEISREFRDHEVRGTLHFTAPEVILRKGYGRPVDWWAMGIILHQFLVGSVPFNGNKRTEIEENIVGGHLCWDCEPIPPFDAQCLITDLLIKNPEQRLGTAGTFEIKSHPFLTGLDFDNLLSQKPEYVPQVASNVDTSFSINHSDINKHLESDDEEDNGSCIYENFTSSSEWLSKLYTTATRINNEDPKSPAEFTQASCTNILEMQKESVPASIRDDDITSLPCSSPLSDIPVHEDRISSMPLSRAQQNSENEEKEETIQDIPVHEDRISSMPLSRAQQNSENEEKEETIQDIPVHEDRISSMPLSRAQQNSENEEKEETIQDIPVHEDRISSMPLSRAQQNSENEEKEETIQDIPVHEDRKSSIPLSKAQQNSENEEKKEKKQRSRLRRFLSSCRRRLSRAARAFTCCCCCPSTI
ncbi:microtubule-associated serine/threonine-protein kinase 4-like isoform X2 [Ranitomeya variabilis]|uniref:microtubule-associated serine/threonine-protein kinase 4-like isoform X2 n=1 Tax=Ranitomeya variabilis TaxID=490064 RepID=UPI0040571D97